MLPYPPPEPLTEEELDRLDARLRAVPGSMNLEQVDGYFSALICGPELVSPGEALQEVLGTGSAFSNLEEANEFFGLLMRLWNKIVVGLDRTLEEPDAYLPLMWQDDSSLMLANDWSTGFMRGMDARRGSWDDLLDDEEALAYVLPMMMLAYENDPDPEYRPPPLDDDKRRELVGLVCVGLIKTFRFFEPYRHELAAARAAAATPIRRAAPKVGRNDPCPCGSGRKYKHCCGQRAQ